MQKKILRVWLLNLYRSFYLLNNKVFLTQTDTTVGFLSYDDKKLNSIKKRPNNQKILSVVDSFYTLKQFVRVPKKFRQIIRRAKTTTFIYPNGVSFRVVNKDSNHHRFIAKYKKLYSTSANETTKSFDIKFAYDNSDIIIYSNKDFKETSGSNIYKVNKSYIKKIR